MINKPIYVAFASKKLEKDFEKLQKEDSRINNFTDSSNEQ